LLEELMLQFDMMRAVNTLLQWHQHSYLLWKIRCILVFPGHTYNDQFVVRTLSTSTRGSTAVKWSIVARTNYV